MIVLEKYRVHWGHTQTLVTRTTKKGKIIYLNKSYSHCYITNTILNTVSSEAVFEHEINKYDRKVGVLQSFKIAVSKCPSKDLRDAFWKAFWEVRKPTLSVASDTVELLACADYVNYEVKKAIIRDDSAKSHVDWQEVGKKDILQYIAGRLQSYRTGSDYALLAIIKWAIIGFTNYKRAKNARIQNQSN